MITVDISILGRVKPKDLSKNNKSFLIDIEGMKCGGCVNSVEQTLLNHPRVSKASVNLVSRTAWIDLKDSEQDIDSILTTLTDRGFPATERSSTSLSELSKDESWWIQWRQLMVALILLMLSVLGHLAEG